MEDQFTVLAIGFAAVSSIASAVAVAISARQVTKNEQVAQVDLFRRFRQQFADTEMNDAIHNLYMWRSEFGEQFADIWAEQLT